MNCLTDLIHGNQKNPTALRACTISIQRAPQSFYLHTKLDAKRQTTYLC